MLRKLRRTMRDVGVRYAARGSTGLFARPGEHYGEVWYALGERNAMSRSTTEPIVLQTIYAIAGITPPTPDAVPAYPGYPLAARPRGAGWLLYLIWPLVVIVSWWFSRQPRRLSVLTPVS